MKLVDDMFKEYHKSFKNIKFEPIAFLEYGFRSTKFRGRMASLSRSEQYEFLDAYKRAADVWKD